MLALAGSAQNPARSNASSRSSPLRAAQISDLDFASRVELARFFHDLKSAGINTVIVRVFQNPGDGFPKLCAPAAQTGYYFRTNSAPMVCDLLGTLADEAHKAGLKFFAWANTRYADYGIEARSDLHSRYYDFATRSMKPGKGLCIFHPEVQARLLGIYSDLARYPIDGVLLQDDLMMRHNEDFSPLAVRAYERERGKSQSPSLFYQGVELRRGQAHVQNYSAEFWDWQNWKAARLLDLADRLREALRASRPGLQFGCNFYYETGLKPDKALAWFSQDVKLAGARNYDFYALMLYHRQLREELGYSGQELGAAVALAAGNFISALPANGEPLLKFATRDFKDGSTVPEQELAGLIQKIPGRGRSGVAFFPVSAGMEKELSNLVASWEQ